ncbi:MAG: hypothetical protein AB8B80_08345 [Marinicellaceae bacterium]
MKKSIYAFMLFTFVIVLSSCGGGGGPSSTGASNPTNPPSDGFNIVLTPVVSSLPANTLDYPAFLGSPFLTQLQVRVTFPNGTVAPDGTTVNLTTSNASVAFISLSDDLNAAFSTVNLATTGGVANFFINSLNQGTSTFTASASTGGRSFSGSLVFQVTPGPDPTFEQLTVVAPRNTLPVNTLGTPFFNGTPFMVEADIQLRDVFGNFTNPAVDGAGDTPTVGVSVTPVDVVYFSILDDPETEDINEFFLRLGQAPVNMVAGHGTIFLWSQNVPGNATVSVLATEAGSGRELTTSFGIEVIDGASDPSLPSTVNVSSDGSALYINGSGGATSQTINMNVQGGNVPVLDPQVNNVMLSLITDAANSGERLSGVDVNGVSVQGDSIKVATVNGIANALINSGSNPNTITVTVTVDRADNNVDNGIQDPISANSSYIVSDGVLWALEITNSVLDVLTVNGDTTNNDGEIIYNFQDGTYSFVLSASATDKQGNPALPQTVQFGMINSPISGYPLQGSGVFDISGNNGDPQEGGSNFTSVGANFLTDAGGVQISDTLLVFGEESQGNEDLESAVTVDTINSQTSLTILERFNRNDETGSINNDFGILPYAVGRNVDGNINATAIIDELGVATTTINYPVSQLGRIAAVYVKGQGAVTNNVAKSVTDVEFLAFPGVEGFSGNSSTLVASPSVIPGNRSVGITVCLADSARNPLPGRFVSFSFVGPGQGSIDNQSGAGVMNTATGFNGCTFGIAETTAIASGTDGAGFNFTSGNLTCDLSDSSNDNCIDVQSTENGVLNANPSSVIGRGLVNIVLSLYDGSGNPIEGAPLSGTCEADDGGSLSINSGPSLTNSSGRSTVSVSISLDAPEEPLTGTCTFAAASGDPSVTVNFTGGNSCNLNNPSPVPPDGVCPDPMP